MDSFKKMLQNRWTLLSVVALGLAARLAVATVGYNYDMRSWFMVADITHYGGNVYAETSRYNYGPVWFLILHGLDWLTGNCHEALRYLITWVLSLADVGIFVLLYRKVGAMAGILFFLNPVSILISGYHCQFDNLAILLTLCAIQFIGDDFDKPVNGRKFGGLLLLGLSLATKHLFFAFPFWLAVKQRGLFQKAIVLCVPVVCFLLGFAPYWVAGQNGIHWHVFHYVPTESNCFYDFFVPPGIQRIWDSESFWYLSLMLFAFICRARTILDSLLIYTGVLVTFSAVTSNQYLAIPIVLTAVYPNFFFAVYTLMSVSQILFSHDGMGLGESAHVSFKHYAIYSLFGGLLWLLWRPRFLQLAQDIGKEMEFQLGRSK